jgi:FkbH-like protein
MILESYLQADAPARAGLFVEFLQALKTMDGEAAAWARRAVSRDLDYSSLMKLRRFIAPQTPAKNRLRLAVLGGPTTTQLTQLLEMFLAGEGIECEIYEGPYGLFRQEILNPDSGLDRFKPQMLFLAVDARDAAATPWTSLWETAHKKWGCAIIQNTFVIEPWAAAGHYALRHAATKESGLHKINESFLREAPSYVTVHPLHNLAAEAGSSNWFDPRFYFDAKMPCAPESLVLYAHSVMSLIRALAGKSKKVLVLDLDNTLWGGTVGDVGAGGIVLGQGSAEGEAFLRFQEFAKALRERGILLAACSKNDEAKAKEPFQSRKDMALKLDDFAYFAANWNNKADNLRTIAQRLNLGLDSFVFVDDNPAERALVRRMLPEAAVPDMPEDAAGYIAALGRHRYFETAALTEEDAKRAAYYEQDAKRQALAAGSADMDAFLSSLNMEATVEPVGALNIERVAQLVNKSNQFNLTTRRRTAGEIRELAARADWITLTVSLRDSLGDNGLISVVFLKRDGKVMDIDTWLMSCRVLQRGMEQFVLNELVRRARDSGCGSLRGAYIPTEKNGLVKNHYASLGFRKADEAWELTLDSFVPLKTHIQRG